MTTKKSSKNAVDAMGHPTPPSLWDAAKFERVRPLWQAAALSMDIEPTTDAVEAACSDMLVKADYVARKKFLGKKLVETPANGHVTFYPHHPYNKAKRGALNRMIDVVSCIEVLSSTQRFPISARFKKLASDLTNNAPLPEYKSSAPSSSVAVIEGKVKRDTSSSASTRKATARDCLLFAMAVSAYKYNPEGTPAAKRKTANAICTDIKKNHFASNGLGEDAILNALLAGEKAAADKGAWT